MHVDWTMSDGLPVGASPSGDVDAEGRVLLRFGRFNAAAPTNPSVLWLVGEADGPVHSAVWQPITPQRGCAIWDYSQMRQSKVAWVITGDDASGNPADSTVTGAIGGDIDALWPTVLARFDRNGTGIYSVGRDFLAAVLNGGVTVYPWSDLASPIRIFDRKSDAYDLEPRDPIVVDGAVFFRFNTLVYDTVMAWSAATGTKPLLRWEGDMTRGAYAFGTDGKDMVWAQGSGRACCRDVDPFPTHDTMTAPFTTDAALLRPRRLRADAEDRPTTNRYVLGCGMAGNTTHDGALSLVRLGDGAGWLLPSAAPPDGGAGASWSWLKVLAVNCDELFAFVQDERTAKMVRITIDSLGAPMPPD